MRRTGSNGVSTFGGDGYVRPPRSPQLYSEPHRRQRSADIINIGAFDRISDEKGLGRPPLVKEATPLMMEGRRGSFAAVPWRSVGRVWLSRLARWFLPLMGLLMGVLLLLQQESLMQTRKTLSSLHQPILELVRPTSEFDKPSIKCPMPGTPRPSDPLTPSLSKPYPVDIILSDFDMSIAHSLTTCNQFRVKVTRKDVNVCRRAATRDVSKSPEMQEFITKKLGPDSFQFRVDGAERYVMDTPTEFNSDECSYTFDFRLNVPGAVWFSGMHYFKDYDGFYELYPNTLTPIAPVYKDFLPAPLQLNLCNGACPEYQPGLLGKNNLVFNPYTSKSSAFAPPPHDLPACSSGPDPVPGTYVPTALPAVLYPPAPLPHNKANHPSGGLYEFVPDGCTWQHDGLRYRDHSSCFEKPHRSLVVGDSHGRAAWDAIRHRLEGNNTVVDRSPKGTFKSAQMGGFWLEFVWQPFIELPHNCEYMDQFDSVIISTGAHQGCFKCDTIDTAAISLQAERIFSEWPANEKKCGKRTVPTKYIFANTPAFQYGPMHEKLECRTNVRLEKWNLEMNRIARKHGWAVVDVHSLTKPFAIETPKLDGIHYMNTDAIDPIGDELIAKMGICGNRAKPNYGDGVGKQVEVIYHKPPPSEWQD
ncbi:hypothetical protein MNV49_007706 [Pseudohyphozyma bogoriensis]|nr:hypothetical protein MNV49_007706 [Pseudohyphozyma bogoriensis]